MVTITVKGTHIFGASETPITSGSVGIKAKFIFDFDGLWNDLTRVAVFKCGDISRDVKLYDDNECEIPWEILVEENVGQSIDIGVCGMMGSEIVLPTIYTNVGRLTQGTKLSDIPPTPHTPSLVEQLIQETEEAKAIAQSVRDDADNGVFNGQDGEKGDPGPKGDPGSVEGIVPGEANNSLVFNSGGDNHAIGEHSIAAGTNSVAGCRGYHISSIDIANKKIYLSNNRVIPAMRAGVKDPSFETPAYNLSDKNNLPYIAITNGPPYLFTAQITAVENNVVSYTGDIGFTSIATDNSDDAYMFFVPEQPLVGAVSFTEAGFSFGDHAVAMGTGSFASGVETLAFRFGHTEGVLTVANYASHAEGEETKATGLFSHAEGLRTKASGRISHVEGVDTVASGQASHAEGHTNEAIGGQSHAEGNKTKAFGTNSHTEGYETKSYGSASHAEGQKTVAGDANDSNKYAAHAEGVGTKATHSGAHSEGWQTVASGCNSHAEGYLSKSTAEGSHAEGKSTTASGYYSHAEGDYTKASGRFAHAEGNTTTAKHNYSHAGGGYTITARDYQEVIGKYNKEDPDALFIVGNGTGLSDAERNNALAVKADGSVEIQKQGTNPGSVATFGYIQELVGQINSLQEQVNYLNGVIESLNANTGE